MDLPVAAEPQMVYPFEGLAAYAGAADEIAVPFGVQLVCVLELIEDVEYDLRQRSDLLVAAEGELVGQWGPEQGVGRERVEDGG